MKTGIRWIPSGGAGLVCWVITTGLMLAGGTGCSRLREDDERAAEIFLGPRFKMEIGEKGIYRLDYDYLRERIPGFEEINPGNTRITNLGEEVAVHVEAGDRKVFRPGDFIEFYAWPLEGEYSADNVFWLSFPRNAAGTRMESIEFGTTNGVERGSGFPARITYEENNHYYDSGSELWFWAEASPANPVEVTLEAPFPLDTGKPGALELVFYGKTDPAFDPNHRAIIRLNGRGVADSRWTGRDRHIIRAEFPGALLRDGDNELSIILPGDTGAGNFDIIYLDKLTLHYFREYRAREGQLEYVRGEKIDGPAALAIAGFRTPQVTVLDITDPRRPGRLAAGDLRVSESGPGDLEIIVPVRPGATTGYLAAEERATKQPLSFRRADATNLRSPDNSADYLAITHPDFIETLGELKAFRESRGLTVRLVDINDVFNEFSHGIPDPGAIRDFLRYARENWAPPRVRYALLVGDATFDYRGHWDGKWGAGVPNFLPSARLRPDGRRIYTTDAWFAEVGGEDLLPDIAIGRLPVQSPEELKTIIDKIVSYEQDHRPAEWKRRVLTVSGREEIFEDFLADLQASFFEPAGLSTQRITANSIAAGAPLADNARLHIAREKLAPALREGINAGCALVIFHGHGATREWGKDELFKTEDIAELNNPGKLPFVLSLTCSSGDFDNPEFECISEELLAWKNGGAIAVLAPTGETSPAIFGREVVKILLANPGMSVGETILTARRDLLNRAAEGGEKPACPDYLTEMMNKFNLLGDPATVIGIAVSPSVPPGPPGGTPSPDGQGLLTQVLENPGEGD